VTSFFLKVSQIFFIERRNQIDFVKRIIIVNFLSENFPCMCAKVVYNESILVLSEQVIGSNVFYFTLNDVLSSAGRQRQKRIFRSTVPIVVAKG